MKLISLNTWGGEAGLEKLLAFIKKHDDVDFFCFQEIWNGGEEMINKQAAGAELSKRVTTLLPEIQKVLPNHASYFRPHFHDYYGLAIFVSNTIRVLEEGDLFVHGEPGFISEKDYGDHSRNLQYITCETPDGIRTILNIHGLWNGQGKFDSEDRLTQSDNIVAFVKQVVTPLVLSGDFNLRPDTESVRKIENAGLRNLITEYGVTSTRTSLYKKTSEQFADYTFVSDGIEVKDFTVLPDEVSDHAPLYLEFT